MKITVCTFTNVVLCPNILPSLLVLEDTLQSVYTPIIDHASAIRTAPCSLSASSSVSWWSACFQYNTLANTLPVRQHPFHPVLTSHWPHFDRLCCL
ncbi:hypothetical protein AX774_g3642 [Zancudomyces culisetae]|uniref:Uncharacterized protein n=1 Tax=Zancudomyces culisetae TaxID=1213189 RepID=A0A1R1PH90_ZANCU|nr:hypothetical protein AX774_g6231 [Zancudomyces culisetae]OMH82428.1 hypothetical protein AX774_g4085 [Zancudomyces culisetae]OMH82864.1 hypothetical protein AX774_g3642 [Zancudomyces culisetae]|eukprot:OMH80340.1 hypothetical protein AX774_g6231 [Zancudomyces culisetae]